MKGIFLISLEHHLTTLLLFPNFKPPSFRHFDNKNYNSIIIISSLKDLVPY